MTRHFIDLHPERPSLSPIHILSDTFGNVFLLLIAEDVHSNPGPPKYPCTLCIKGFRGYSKAIECDDCRLLTNFYECCEKVLSFCLLYQKLYIVSDFNRDGSCTKTNYLWKITRFFHENV